MRLLVEIFLIGGLLYVGWKKPYRDWLPESVTGPHSAKQPPVRLGPSAPYQPFVRQTPPPTTTSVAVNAPPQARPSVTVSGGWMWDANHRSALDPPRHSPTPH